MGDCQICHQLWRKHTFATREHVSLENKLRMAALRRDYDRHRALKVGVEAVDRERVRLRARIRAHDASAHNGVVKACGPDLITSGFRALASRERRQTVNYSAARAPL